MEIIPAILTNSIKEFDYQLGKLSFVSIIQVDFMDGLFVDTKSINPKDLHELNGFFEAHLMVKNPANYFDVLKQKGFKRVIFHFESTKNINQTILKAKSLNLEPCIAFNPKSDPKVIEGVKRYLFLTVNPGRQGQKFLKETLNKIVNFKQQNPSLTIGVDGGITDENIHLLMSLDFICVGSFITKSDNMEEQYKKLVRNGAYKKG